MERNISDYRDIGPRYGTLADWDNLLSGVHEHSCLSSPTLRALNIEFLRPMKDLVVNHTSDEVQKTPSNESRAKSDCHPCQ